MNLTPELKNRGRRNFLKTVAGTPALAALAGATALQGPRSGGPVKAALVGAGAEGKVLLGQLQKNWIDVRAICDINPAHSRGAAEAMQTQGWPRPREYEDVKEMLAKEDLEAVIVATPLWTHADISVACLEAGKHVLCEKMMAIDVKSCGRMLDAARKAGRVLEVGHQRFYNPMYQATYEGILRKNVLGDIHYITAGWHRNISWRREEPPPSPGYDPSRWGYPTWEHLLNWRVYRRYSGGLMAELGSHHVAIANWFLGASPEAVYASGGIHRFKDGREVFDHIYATFDYPGGRNLTFTSIQSNDFEGNYEQIMGTKGTLILRNETEAYLFGDAEAKATGIEMSPRGSSNAVIDASESRAADATGRTVAQVGDSAKSDRLVPYRNEITGFCASIRSGVPLLCGPERALAGATACINATDSGFQKTRLTIA